MEIWPKEGMHSLIKTSSKKSKVVKELIINALLDADADQKLQFMYVDSEMLNTLKTD